MATPVFLSVFGGNTWICFAASTINPTDNLSQGQSRKHHLVGCFGRVIKGSEAGSSVWYVRV